MFNDAPTALKAPADWTKVGKEKSYGASSVWKVQDAKDAGRAFGATLNDVVHAAVSAAMRRYLQHRDCKVIKSKKGDRLTVRALAVVNTRMGTPGDGILKNFMQCKAANEFSYVMPTLPLGDMTVEERVLACSKDMTYLKSSPEAVLMKGVNNAIRDCFGGAFTVWLNSKMVLNQFTCFFSNLP